MNELDELQKTIWALHFQRQQFTEKQAAEGEMRTALENTQEYANLRLAEASLELAKIKINELEKDVRKLAKTKYLETGDTDFGGAYITKKNVGEVKDPVAAVKWAVSKTLYGLLTIDAKAFDTVAKKMVALDPDLASFFRVEEIVSASIRKDLKEHLR